MASSGNSGRGGMAMIRKITKVLFLVLALVVLSRTGQAVWNEPRLLAASSTAIAMRTA